MVAPIHYFFVLPRYPYDEAATVAISTVKEFGSDLKEVLLLLLMILFT